MNIMKILIATLFLYFSSKAFASVLKTKAEIKSEIALGLGYLFNLALFFGLTFFIMLLKLSSTWMIIAGIVYLIISFYFIIKSIINKELFKFSKKELIALFIATAFLFCFGFFIDFGHIETYDSYYYSMLTNSGITSDKVSIIDPYTGLSNMDNFYKYISYYYQAGFIGTILKINLPSLVLIWSFSFMNFFFIAISALGIARISEKEYVNNIISVLVLTTFLSFIRAPFNALHIVTLISSFYLIKYAFEVLDDKKYSLFLYLITTIACISITSTTLFVTLPIVYLVLIANSILCKRKDFKNVFILGIPPVILGFIYIYESTNNFVILLAALGLLLGIYILLRSKIFNILVKWISRMLVFLIPIFLFLLPSFLDAQNFTQNFTKRDGLTEEESLPETTEETLCIKDGTYEIEIDDYFYDDNHSTAMNYIYKNNNSTASTLLIYLTHSFLKFGGMLFLFIYGIFKLKKDPIYLGYLIYLLTFLNPFINDGLQVITVNLSGRIKLFFNLFFGVYGLKYFFDFIEEVINKNNLRKIWEKVKNKLWIILLIAFVTSITAFVLLFKQPNWKKYDLLTKIPHNFVEVEEVIEKEFSNLKSRPRVFYTASAFNVSMLDDTPNDHIKVINSKEYMNFFANQNFITDKILINLYFETEGNVKADTINIPTEDEPFNLSSCEILALLNTYGIDYIVTKKGENQQFNKYIKNNFNIIYENSELMFLKVEK